MYWLFVNRDVLFLRIHFSLQEPNGRVLDKWSITTREEEQIILQQFLRFGETKSIAQEIILQDTKDNQDMYIKQTARADSEIKKFIERSNMSMHGYIRPFDSRHLYPTRLPFVATGSRLMTPPTVTSFSSPESAHDLRPPVITIPSSSPVTTSPLGKLQTMQPFDYRRDMRSPSISPGLPEKQIPNRSPSVGSPRNISSTPTSAHSTPSPIHTHKMEISDIIPMSSTPIMTLPIIHPPQVGSIENALDYSKKDHDDEHNSMYADRKVKHLRKSANPIKRQWMPSAGFGTTFVGPNGKKRVLCTACNKTFCDKGALKIHYSAVHLKEMHKCTVDGCNMMFSSRRSRNRHSANPNPKLHMPQKRIKLPDGATIVDDGSKSGLVSSSPTMVVSSPMDSHTNLHQSQESSISEQAYFASIGVTMNLFPSPQKKLKLDPDVDIEDEGPRDLTMPEVKFTKEDSNDDQNKWEVGSQRAVSRRKNTAPTKCAQMDDHFVMSDENSNDKEHTAHNKTDDNGIKGPEDLRIDSAGEDQLTVQENHSSAESTDSEGHRLGIIIDGLTPQEGDRKESGSKRTSFGRGRPRKHFPKIASLLAARNEAEALDFSQNNNNTPDDIASVSDCHTSEHESNMSHSSDEDDENSRSNINGIEIPLDKENPRKCTACGKIFQNHFGVKLHYKNVHLKLMHMCTVEGCAATFPSKRSRDRHSSNLKLHKKILSASDSENESDHESEKSLRDDIIQKLYNLKGIAGCEEQTDAKCGPKTNGHTLKSPDSGSDDDDNGASDPSKGQNYSQNGIDNDNEDLENFDDGDERAIPDENGLVTCHICQVKVRDNLVLKEHFENTHPKEMFNCTIKGCDKIFSTRKSRNRHSQNDNLHRHLPIIKINTLS